MESNYQEESCEDDSSGIGRSYECVFCKRGFNTAQALGGHMNIHRKDRARNKPKQHGDAGSGGSRFGSTPPRQPHHHDLPYFLPPIVSTNSTSYERSNHQHHRDRDDSDWDRPQPSNPVIPGDWRIARLSLVEEGEAKNQQDKELDLELRLGWL